MTNENDRVIVNGDFVTDSSVNHEEKLTAGIMTIGGNFTQLNSNNGRYNFAANENHKVVLSGNTVQNISSALDSVISGYFKRSPVKTYFSSCLYQISVDCQFMSGKVKFTRCKTIIPFNRLYFYSTNATAGTIEIKGNFTSKTSNFNPNTEHKIIFNE